VEGCGGWREEGNEKDELGSVGWAIGCRYHAPPTTSLVGWISCTPIPPRHTYLPINTNNNENINNHKKITKNTRDKFIKKWKCFIYNKK
jgi:hypothetical protein